MTRIEINDMDIIKQIKGITAVQNTDSIDDPFIQTFMQNNATTPFIDGTIKMEQSSVKTSGSYNNVVFFNAQFGNEPNKRFVMRMTKSNSEAFEPIVEKRNMRGDYFETEDEWNKRNMATKNAIINDYAGFKEVKRNRIRKMLKKWNGTTNITTFLFGEGMSSFETFKLSVFKDSYKLKMVQFLEDIAFSTKSYEIWRTMSEDGIGLKVYAYAYFQENQKYKLGVIMDAADFDLKTCIENLQKPRNGSKGMRFVPRPEAEKILDRVSDGMKNVPDNEKMWKGELECNLFGIKKEAPLTSFEVLVAEKTTKKIHDQVFANVLCTDLKGQNCAATLIYDDQGNVTDVDVYIIDIDSDFCESINVGDESVKENNVTISNLFMSNQFYYRLGRNIFCQHFINKIHTEKVNNIPTDAALPYLCNTILGKNWRLMIKHYLKWAVRVACNTSDRHTCPYNKKEVCEKLFDVLNLNALFLNKKDQKDTQSINDKAAKACAVKLNTTIPNMHLDNISRSSPSQVGFVKNALNFFKNVFMGGSRNKTKKRRKVPLSIIFGNKLSKKERMKKWKTLKQQKSRKKKTRKKKKISRIKKKKRTRGKRIRRKRTFRKPTF